MRERKLRGLLHFLLEERNKMLMCGGKGVGTEAAAEDTEGRKKLSVD